MNQNDYIAKGIRFGVLGVIMILSVYIIFKLGSLYLVDTISNNFTSLMNDSFTKLASSIYCSSSSAVDYTLTSNSSEPNSSYLLSSIYSPFVQYVQASNQASTDQTSGATDELIIYDEESSSTESNTEATPNAIMSTEPTLSPSELTMADSNIYSEIYFEDESEGDDAEPTFAEQTLSGSAYDTLKNNQLMITKLKENLDRNYLLDNFYRVNKLVGIDPDIWNVKELLQKDLTLTKNPDEPQILIFHTHAHEAFADSKSGERSDTIVGVGDELTRILEEEYGYTVLHYSKQYEYNGAYNDALKDLQQILKEHPSIEVIFDLHRDGVDSKNKTHTSVTINDVEMAKIMFFNGVSYSTSGARKGLYNKNLQNNLAFSLQMKLYAMEQFPELTKNNALKSYRFNMHLVGRYSLIECGDNNNTVAEVKAAMQPLAAIIDHTLTTKNEYNQ